VEKTIALLKTSTSFSGWQRLGWKTTDRFNETRLVSVERKRRSSDHDDGREKHTHERAAFPVRSFVWSNYPAGNQNELVCVKRLFSVVKREFKEVLLMLDANAAVVACRCGVES
jgi:hypothetical protein